MNGVHYMSKVPDKYVVMKCYDGKSFIVARNLSGSNDQFIPACRCETRQQAELIMNALVEYEVNNEP